MSDPLVNPSYQHAFVNQQGFLEPRVRRWVDEVSRIGTLNGETIDSILDRLDELEPQFVTKDNTDSPYSAKNMDYILADMSLGDLDIILPSSGRVFVSRFGGSNTLTLIGTVNGVVDPIIVADGDAPAMVFIGSEWRYV
jgi:hypothetical protein